MKIQGGNIDKTEDKIIRVDQTESEETSNPVQSVLGVTDLLPGLSILQLSDVGPKKTFKGNRGKALIVSDNEQYMTFGDAGGGGNVTPITLDYDANLTVYLGRNLNYILTLTGDCVLTLANIIPGYTYKFLIIQDNIGGHTLTISHPCFYQDGYTQDTARDTHSILTIDYINDEYYASISKYAQMVANITWEDYDGTTLDTGTVFYGETPEYTGPTPTRAGYVFMGWSPTPAPATGDITYTAQYEEMRPGLCFTAKTAGSTIELDLPYAYYPYLRYSTDGANWNNYGGETLTLNSIGDKVYFRNTESRQSYSSGNDVCKFTMTGSFESSGDVTYLINPDGGDVSLLYRCFRELFKDCTSLLTPPSLPSTNVGSEGYRSMFSGCTNLTTAPELPATTLGTYCYSNMFNGCTSLTEAPDLLATSISEGCYQAMFNGCTSLITAPSILPALTAQVYCYSNMFNGCTSLTEAPELPATTLGSYCYGWMFYGCTSLSTITKLPATTLVTSCYTNMFRNCTNIKLSTTQTGAYQTQYKVPSSGTGTDASNSMLGMLVGTGGTFTGTVETGGPVINTTYYTSNTVV